MKKAATRRTSANGDNKTDQPFYIVAIGASAGGIEAVTELFRELPADTGMAYVYIQHLDPSHKSMLTTILGRATPMKVVEARHLLRIESNHVYIIPPGQDMSVEDGVLVLNKREKSNGHMPVDQFFISLAEKHKAWAIGIILSGNAHDGTQGLKAIKAAGGLTFAQDETAKFQSMPRSAFVGGAVDLVLAPQEMARELQRISKQGYAQLLVVQETDKDIPAEEEQDIKTIIQFLKRATGTDFSHYKINTIKRRIVRRLLLHKLESLKEYVKYLRQNNSEADLLYHDLLIHVTSFFRNPDAMEYLEKILFPRILDSKTKNETIRIWVPACSTGEEAYSIAILFKELLAEKASLATVHIFATDLSESAIAKARLGVYTRNELEGVSPRRLQQFFVKADGSYRVDKAIRDMCVFAPHNIFNDPPFSRLDFISCCNLLIYLDTVLQNKIMRIFFYGLSNNGYLMLGRSETIGNSGQLFSQVEKKYKIYQKRKDAVVLSLHDLDYHLPETERIATETGTRSMQKSGRDDDALNKLVEAMLSAYTPASVVVDNSLEILQFRGSTGLFLEPSPGRASLNLLKMAKPGLAFELRNALHKASKSGERVKKTGLEIREKNGLHHCSIEVLPLKPREGEQLFLVLFEEVPPPVPAETHVRLLKDKMVKQLQDELYMVKEDMRSMIEEQEAGKEELQSANEEVVSSNEELQSINEELETSKEELESANEELMTINTELQLRNEQLEESYVYAESVFENISEAVLVLDRSLFVKAANSAFYQLFHAKKEETEGCLVYELGNKQWDIPRLRLLLEDIIPQNTRFDRFEVTHDFPAIGRKVMLLNAIQVVQHGQQLILLTIEDITGFKKAEKIITEREVWFRNMADNAPVMIWVAASNRNASFFNNTWLTYTGRSLDQEAGNGWMENVHPEDLAQFLVIYDKSFKEQAPYQVEYRLKRHDGEYRWMLNIGRPSFSPEGVFTGFIGTCTEIHEKHLINAELEKNVEQRTHDLKELNKELERSNKELEQFAYIASHDLQEPLRKILTFADSLKLLKEGLSEKGISYINKITNASERMNKLIDDLLNFSRISRTHGIFTRTDLDAILKDVLVDFDLSISQKKAKIRSDTLQVIEANPVEMKQLFHNLIGNALKFSKKNIPPEITISSHKLTEEEVKRLIKNRRPVPYVAIVFKDNGIGFNPEYCEQVFDIFQRLNANHEYPGTGIGLALCRRIVNNHGGEIYADSKENEGATFHVILPLEQPQEENL